MNIALWKKWAEFLEQKIATGIYTSPTDVVEEALQVLRDRNERNWIDFAEIERLPIPQ